jgi:hypothetical protein
MVSGVWRVVSADGARRPSGAAPSCDGPLGMRARQEAKSAVT